MDDDRPYVIHSPTKITLKPMAREMCKMHGMSEEQMARHLLQQHKLQESGLIQRDGEN
jgi:hypothetical protein